MAIKNVQVLQKPQTPNRFKKLTSSARIIDYAVYHEKHQYVIIKELVRVGCDSL